MEQTTTWWMDEIVDSIGEFICLETVDGVQREGKLTGITYKEIFFNKKKERYPIEVELNGDPSDRVHLSHLRNISIG